MADVAYDVPGIMCEGCANAIKRAMRTLDGIHTVEVDVSAKRVAVSYDEDKAQPDEIARRIENAGYEVKQP